MSNHAGHGRHIKLYPDFELEDEGATGRRRREFKHFKGWSLEEIEEHEEHFESEFPNRLSNRYGVRHYRDHYWGVCLYTFVEGYVGLHVDEVYHRLTYELRGAPYRRMLAIRQFLKKFGALRLRWNDDGSRYYGRGKFFFDDGYIAPDESGILVKREYEVDPPVDPVFLNARRERLDAIRSVVHDYPYWDSSGCYRISEDQFYSKERFVAHFLGSRVHGALWMVFDRVSDGKSSDFTSHTSNLGLSLECYYEPRIVYFSGVAWRRNVVPSDVACRLETLWRNEGQDLSRIERQREYSPWELEV